MATKQQKQKRHEQAQAAMLAEMIDATFIKAYALAAQGMTHTAMLIDYDIQAAAVDQHESINACARTVIKAACNAVDKRIPFIVAHAYLMARVGAYVDDLLAKRHAT